MKNHALTLFALLLLSPVLHASEEAKPVVISLSAVGDYTTPYGHAAAALLRPRIVTALVRDYDCVVLSRSICDTLATETLLSRMKSTADGEDSESTILAADYAVRAHLRKGNRPNTVTVFLGLQDLRHNDNRAPEKYSWQMEGYFFAGSDAADAEKVIASIATKVASSLSLNARTDHRNDIAEQFMLDGQTWAVPPFAQIDATKEYGQSLRRGAKNWWFSRTLIPCMVRRRVLRFGGDDAKIANLTLELNKKFFALEKLRVQAMTNIQTMSTTRNRDYFPAEAVELALHKNGHISLVDRADIDRILDELSLHSMIGMNENMGGHVARLAGADRIVIGITAQMKQGVHLTLHLVDAKSSLILNAAEATCSDAAGIPAEVERIAGEFSKAWSSAPTIADSAKWQRQKEAEFYLSEIFPPASSKPRKYCVSEKATWLNCIEINYLLMHDHPKYIAERVLPQLRELMSAPASASIEDYSRAAYLLDAILYQFTEGNSLLPSPILLRANGHLEAWHFKRALALANEYKQRHREANANWADYIAAESLHFLGESERAIELAKGILSRHEQSSAQRYSHKRTTRYPVAWEDDHYGKALNLLVRIAQHPDSVDEKLELYALKKGGRFDFVHSALRLLELVGKYEGLDKTIDLYPRFVTDSGELAQCDHGLGFHIDLHVADNLMKLGREQEAVEIYERVMKHCRPPTYAREQLKKAGRDDLLTENKTREEIHAANGITKYASAAEICFLPQDYKIYCYPVAGINSNYVETVCKLVGAWMGTTVVIENALPMPIGTLVVEDARHDVASFSRQLLQSISCHEDAMFIFFITDAPLPRSASQNIPVTPSRGNPVVVTTFNSWQNIYVSPAYLWREIVNYGIMPAIAVPIRADWTGWETRFPPEEWRMLCRKKECKAFPRAIEYSPNVMCEDCRKRYAKGDGFAAAHKALQAFMKRKHKVLSAGYSPPPSDYSDELNWRDDAVVEQTRRDANDGNPIAQYLMGIVYGHGLSLPGDEENASISFRQSLKGLEKLAAAGGLRAQNCLGRIYLNGYGLDADHDKAFQLFDAAAKSGDTRSQIDLGKMHEAGYGTRKDISVAMKWYRSAANNGSALAQVIIGERLFFDDVGVGMPHDYPKAVDLFIEASEKGFPLAMTRLGDAYRLGRGVERDKERAIELYKKAAARGCEKAIQRLGHIYCTYPMCPYCR